MLTPLIASAMMLAPQTQTPNKVWFMFFLKGNGQRPADAKVLAQMQADHIKNLGDQAEKGHLIAAGPLADPTQLRRGITVAIAKSRDEIDSFFATDAYVKSGIMTVTATEWELSPDCIRKDYDKANMAEYELLITDHPLLRSYRNALRSFAVGGRTKFVGSEKYRFSGEVWITLKSNHEKLVNAIDGPRDGVEIIPLWMAANLIKPAG